MGHWKFIVKEIGGQVLLQTDSLNNAVSFSIHSTKHTKVIDCLSDEVIYRNF